MRISGGSLRGKRITCPPGVIRPAMDRMRESMFSILGPLDGVSFLDLFSGSGLVGIEAWSREARPVVLVERDRGKKATIQRNTEELEPQPLVRIEPVERFVQRNRQPYDIIYLDPPFDYAYKNDLLRRLAASRTVHERSLLIIHAPAAEQLSPPGDFVLRDRRTYGGSQLSFYHRP